MTRTCYICGGPLPEKAKGSFCSKECYEKYRAYKQQKARSNRPSTNQEAAADTGIQVTSARKEPARKPARSPEQGPAPSFAQAAGRGAYRRNSNSYLGVIISERQRSTDGDDRVEEWTIKDALGGTVHVPKNQIRIGETLEKSETDPLQEDSSGFLIPDFLRSSRVRNMSDAPLRIKLIGGVYIYLGALGLWIGISALVALFVFSGLWSGDKSLYPPEIIWFKVLTIIMICTSILAVIAAYKLFRMRAWARLALEILSWTAVAAGIIATAYALIGSQSLAVNSLVKGTLFINIIFMAIMVLAPFVAVLHFLREPETRKAARN